MIYTDFETKKYIYERKLRYDRTGEDEACEDIY